MDLGYFSDILERGSISASRNERPNVDHMGQNSPETSVRLQGSESAIVSENLNTFQGHKLNIYIELLS